MRNYPLQPVVGQFIFFTTFILSLALLNTPGTIDVLSWLEWIDDYKRNGIVHGYANSHTDYPPLMALIFYGFTLCFNQIGIEDFFAVKITIFVFSILSSLLVLHWTKSFTLSTVFHIAFILNSVCLGYADVILGFFLLASLYALYKRNLLLFAGVFTVSVFIKWQALIISPFLFIYILHMSNSNTAFSKNALWRCLWPSALIAILVIVIFGFHRLMATFSWALHHQWLSANALNANWILTFLFRVFSPETFGGLIHGEITYASAENPPLPFLLFKFFFISAFFYTLYVFYKIRSSFESLLAFSLAGYLLYFIFNTGVHENHLFLAVILSVLLASFNNRYFSMSILIVLAFNINLLLFYGLTGRLAVNRILFNAVDPTLLFALANTIIFVWFWLELISDSNHQRPPAAG